MRNTVRVIDQTLWKHKGECNSFFLGRQRRLPRRWLLNGNQGGEIEGKMNSTWTPRNLKLHEKPWLIHQYFIVASGRDEVCWGQVVKGLVCHESYPLSDFPRALFTPAHEGGFRLCWDKENSPFYIPVFFWACSGLKGFWSLKTGSNSLPEIFSPSLPLPPKHLSNTVMASILWKVKAYSHEQSHWYSDWNAFL